ncbi:hypothetical protein CNEONATC25_02193 [Clostridium neonatale]|nr:hypothetical protein CNEONATC25_02193 [Clostridium neonatale]SUQ47733.1 hypothetical protein CNEONATNEC32_02163 [Clostridium neonatale]SUQ48295.1 hypothetical protein CNEONATNEC26_02155 [Clostridium neonatale]
MKRRSCNNNLNILITLGMALGAATIIGLSKKK